MEALILNEEKIISNNCIHVFYSTPNKPTHLHPLGVVSHNRDPQLKES